MGLDFITYDEVGKKLGYNTDTTGIYVDTNREENTEMK